MKKNPGTLIETETFLATDMVKEMVQNVTNRFRLPEGYLSVGKKHHNEIYKF